jgi:hypothetical protein
MVFGLLKEVQRIFTILEETAGVCLFLAFQRSCFCTLVSWSQRGCQQAEYPCAERSGNRFGGPATADHRLLSDFISTGP